MSNRPVPFEVHESGALFHGTKVNLAVGDLIRPGYPSNFASGRTSNHVYVTATLDAAAWGAELAAGTGGGRVYIVEPTGEVRGEANVTDKRCPGHPARSYRSRAAVRVGG